MQEADAGEFFCGIVEDDVLILLDRHKHCETSGRFLRQVRYKCLEERVRSFRCLSNTP